MIYLTALLVHRLCGGDCTITLPNGEVLPNTYKPKPKEKRKNTSEADESSVNKEEPLG